MVNKDDKLEITFNAKSMNAILSGLTESKFIKIMHCKIATNVG